NGQPAVTEEITRTIQLKEIAASIQHWAMNKNITYIININPLEENQKISFDFDVEEWGSQNGSWDINHTM
ncbi:MAG: hypothetical protein IJF06_03775, partial [Bacteroidaceae bacterium]|nr:hypothetical protein [Bacteroidaceae bacterium]